MASKMTFNNKHSIIIFAFFIFVLAFFATSASAATDSTVAKAASISSLNIEDLKSKINESLGGTSKAAQMTVMVIAVRLIGFLMGLVLFVTGLLRIRKNAENPNSHSIASCIWMLVSGTLLISLGSFYSIVSATLDPSLVGQSNSILAVNAHISLASGSKTGSGFSQFIPTEAGQSIMAFVYFIGMLSFVRGIMLLKDLGSPQGQQMGIGKPITHILGGAVAMNILKFSCMVGAFIGSDVICLTGA
jgi:hypothetical protein